jgi:hypothetical protein
MATAINSRAIRGCGDSIQAAQRHSVLLTALHRELDTQPFKMKKQPLTGCVD